MITIHNSENTVAVVCIPLDQIPNLGPFPSYVGSYDNLLEVSKAAAADCLIRSGWDIATVTRATLIDNHFEVTVIRRAA